jgi:hypothetical protein
MDSPAMLIDWPRKASLLDGTFGDPFNEARLQQIESPLTSMAHQQGGLDADTTSNDPFGLHGGPVDVQWQMLSGLCYRVNHMVTQDVFSRGSQRILEAGFGSLGGKMDASAKVDLNFHRALDPGMFALLDVQEIKTERNSKAAYKAKRSGDEDATPLTELSITGEETNPKTLGFDLFRGPQIGITYKNTHLSNRGNTLAAELNWSAAWTHPH